MADHITLDSVQNPSVNLDPEQNTEFELDAETLRVVNAVSPRVTSIQHVNDSTVVTIEDISGNNVITLPDGAKGDQGDAAYSVITSCPCYVFPGNRRSAIRNSSISFSVKIKCGSEQKTISRLIMAAPNGLTITNNGNMTSPVFTITVTGNYTGREQGNTDYASITLYVDDTSFSIKFPCPVALASGTVTWNTNTLPNTSGNTPWFSASSLNGPEGEYPQIGDFIFSSVKRYTCTSVDSWGHVYVDTGVDVRGPQGAKGETGDKGDPGNDYVLTSQDKSDIAAAAATDAVALMQDTLNGKLDSSLKGAANGLAELDSNGKVPSSQLPAFVDDVLEYTSSSEFPNEGSTGLLYVAKDTNLVYRWSGSAYIEISPSLALGTTSSTAYRGDRGSAAYQHAVTNKGAAFVSGLYKITTNAEGHVTDATAIEKSDITSLGIPGSVPTKVSDLDNDAGYLTSHQDITGKADKVIEFANGDFAALDSHGNLTDSGHKHSDYITDVQVDGGSTILNGVATIPKASQTGFGVVKTKSTGGIKIDSSDKTIIIDKASASVIKAGSSDFAPIVASNEDAAAFYGLAKAAGDNTQYVSSNAVGTYTEDAESAIRSMIGAGTYSKPSGGIPSTDMTEAVQTSLGKADTALQSAPVTSVNGQTGAVVLSPSDIGAGTYSKPAGGIPATDLASGVIPDLTSYVTNTDYGTASTAGVVKVDDTGIQVNSSGVLSVKAATSTDVRYSTSSAQPLTPSTIDTAAFYGLAKAAGIDEKENTTLGTYTTEAKAAIRTMLGAAASSDIPSVPVTDVQMNGASILNNGVANVPKATAGSLGVVTTDLNYGTYVNDQGRIAVLSANSAQVKEAAQGYRPVTPLHQHEAAFYGLSKAAGIDLANETVTLGTYPAASKAAIQTMLGVENGVGFVETVVGTTPAITCLANTRYKCGEVSTISIIPPSEGTVDVMFTSGTIAAVLTIPNTVKFPQWFDPSVLQTDTIYEVVITDGVYGSVMLWSL